MLATIDKAIRITISGEDYKELFNEIALNSAKAHLIASISIIDKLEFVNEKLGDWSLEYRKSLPIRIGDTSLGIKSSTDQKHREIADSLYPELLKEFQVLVSVIKLELDKLKRNIEN